MMQYQVNNCGVVILAAGESSRLGASKQLLAYRDKSLLAHTADIAISAALKPVVVVLGANREEVNKEVAGKDVEVLNNEEWQEGMASSLRNGLKHLSMRLPENDAVIFMVCDQPFVHKELLQNLLKVQAETGKPAVASSYQGKLGTPALFHKVLWPDLLQLKGDAGGRKLLNEMKNDVAVVPFEQGITDIDTMEDYEQLLH